MQPLKLSYSKLQLPKKKSRVPTTTTDLLVILGIVDLEAFLVGKALVAESAGGLHVVGPLVH